MKKNNTPISKKSGDPLFRLARPDDYEHIPELGLYELTFDKRPVQGVRCENPEEGARQYNMNQQRIREVRLKERRHRRNFTPLMDLSWNGIFGWCLDKGTPEECRLMLALYRSHDREEQRTLRREMRQHDGINRETNILTFAALFSITGNRLAPADKILAVEMKGAKSEKNNA